MNARKDTGSVWNENKKRVVEILTKREMSTSEVAAILGIKAARVPCLMNELPETALIYEYNQDGITIYGRLK